MADNAPPQHRTYEEQPAAPHGDAGGHAEVNPMAVSGPMMVWTWITFGLLTAVLYKFAWKPILSGLENREETIRKSLDDAERVRRKIEDLEQTQSRMIADADDTAKDIVSKARKAAGEAARVIEDRAKEETQIAMENARREIQAAQDKASAQLQRESAELAAALAGKILNEELTPERQRTLADRLIREL